MIEGKPIEQRAQFYPVDTWDRDWTYYRVSPVFSDDKTDEKWPTLSAEEMAEYDSNLARGWTSHIYALTTPITDHNLKDIIVGSDYRVYPPFELNRKEAVSHSFSDVRIPLGAVSVSEFMDVPDYAVRGAKGDMSINGAVPKYGLRLDVKGDNAPNILSKTLELIRQFTFQWWINTARNPFDEGVRMHFEMQKDFRPRSLFKCAGRQGQNGPWSAAFGTQPLLGHELPLNNFRWGCVSKWLTNELSADYGITLFNNAVESYMSFRDRDAVLNLSLQFEVCENRLLLANGKTDIKRNKDLLKTSQLVRGSDRDLMRKIITDRDNVAHGRAPYHITKDPTLLKKYMSLGRQLVDAYVEQMNNLGWERVSKLHL